MRRAATTAQLRRDKTSFRTPFSRATPRHLASTRRGSVLFRGLRRPRESSNETPRGSADRVPVREEATCPRGPARFPHRGKLISPRDRRRRIPLCSLFSPLFHGEEIPSHYRSDAAAAKRERERERERERDRRKRSLSHGESLRKESQLQATRLIYATKGPRYG